MIKFLLSAILSLSFISLSAIDKHQAFIHFPTDGHQLSKEAKAELQKLLQKLPSDFEYAISISGHTDNMGTAGYNEGLAKRRALEVKRFLLSAGMQEEQIEVEKQTSCGK